MKILFPIFLHFFFGNREAEQPHYDIDSKNLKRGLHIDINSIFPDFFPNFLVNSKISWPIKIYGLFPEFFRL